MAIDNSIYKLNEQDYSHKPRVQYHIEGQTASIRPFDPNDKLDIKRLAQIMASDKVQKFMDDVKEEDRSKKTLQEWVAGSDGQPEFLFAVSGSRSHPELAETEIGEVQGFIYAYKLNGNTRNSLFNRNLITEEEFNLQGIETGYAMHPDAPSHQISSACRTACVYIDQLVHKDNQQITKPNTLFIARVNRENTKSQFALESAGYENRGLQGADIVYVLNWDKLNDKLSSSK